MWDLTVAVLADDECVNVSAVHTEMRPTRYLSRAESARVPEPKTRFSGSPLELDRRICENVNGVRDNEDDAAHIRFAISGIML
jgi:hypothetical protein